MKVYPPFLWNKYVVGLTLVSEEVPNMGPNSRVRLYLTYMFGADILTQFS